VGALLFITMLVVVGLLTAKTFDLHGWAYPLAYLPSLALLLCMTQLGYMLYYIKVDGYVYNNIIGVLFLLSGFLAFKKIGSIRNKSIFAVVYIVTAYPICGVYGLVGGFLMLLASLKSFFETKQKGVLIQTLLLLLFLVLTPILYYSYLFEQIAFGDIFIADLPYFTFKGAERILWFPFLSMAVYFFCVLWLKPRKESLPNWRKVLPLALFLISLALVFVVSFKDENFNSEIQMMNAVDHEKWNDVLKIARNHRDEPTRLLVITTNLALYKLGIAGDVTYQYKNGDKPMNSPRIIVPIHIAGPSFFYQYGLPNYCTKWCMEGIVEYGFNVSVLKYFILSSLLNGDVALAKKYNDVLHSTLFYRSWANKHQQYIDHPETITTAAEFQSILPLTNYVDVLNGDYNNLEAFLRNHFSVLGKVPAQLTELSVIYNLDIKDDKQFWPRLFRWVKLNPTRKIPVHFQEAALLFADLTKIDISGAPFDPNVVVSFKNFLAMVQQYENYPEDALKNLLYPQFGKTYWYYYFFAKSHEIKKEDENGYKY
jgi:hypothetical protein